MKPSKTSEEILQLKKEIRSAHSIITNMQLERDKLKDELRILQMNYDVWTKRATKAEDELAKLLLIEEQAETMFYALEDIANEHVKNLGSARIIARRAMSKVVHMESGIDTDI